MPSPAAGSQARSWTHRHVVPAGHPGIGILPVQPAPVKIHTWERQQGCQAARGQLPHPASEGTPSTVQPPEQGALGGPNFGGGPGELVLSCRARAHTPFLTSCPAGES